MALQTRQYFRIRSLRGLLCTNGSDTGAQRRLGNAMKTDQVTAMYKYGGQAPNIDDVHLRFNTQSKLAKVPF